MTDVAGLRDQLREFAAARDWGQFHAPKNLENAAKDPVDKARGSSRKSTEL